MLNGFWELRVRNRRIGLAPHASYDVYYACLLVYTPNLIRVPRHGLRVRVVQMWCTREGRRTVLVRRRGFVIIYFSPRASGPRAVLN